MGPSEGLACGVCQGWNQLQPAFCVAWPPGPLGSRQILKLTASLHSTAQPHPDFLLPLSSVPLCPPPEWLYPYLQKPK